MSWKEKLKNLVLTYVENAGYRKFEDNAIYFAPNWNRKITVKIDESLNVPPILIYNDDESRMFYLKNPFNIYERMEIPTTGGEAQSYHFTTSEYSFDLSIYFYKDLNDFGYSGIEGIYIYLSDGGLFGGVDLTCKVYDKNNNLISSVNNDGDTIVPYDAKEFTIAIEEHVSTTIQEPDG